MKYAHLPAELLQPVPAPPAPAPECKDTAGAARLCTRQLDAWLGDWREAFERLAAKLAGVAEIDARAAAPRR